jgi:hypothetical protein
VAAIVVERFAASERIDYEKSKRSLTVLASF